MEIKDPLIHLCMYTQLLETWCKYIHTNTSAVSGICIKNTPWIEIFTEYIEHSFDHDLDYQLLNSVEVHCLSRKWLDHIKHQGRHTVKGMLRIESMGKAVVWGKVYNLSLIIVLCV